MRNAVAEAYFVGPSSLALNKQFVQPLWNLSSLAQLRDFTLGNQPALPPFPQSLIYEATGDRFSHCQVSDGTERSCPGEAMPQHNVSLIQTRTV